MKIKDVTNIEDFYLLRMLCKPCKDRAGFVFLFFKNVILNIPGK